MPPKIQDEFTKLKVSRERRRQLRNRKRGLCRCGQEIESGLSCCLKCLERSRSLMRRRGGYKEWKEGGRGRPPIVRPSKSG